MAKSNLKNNKKQLNKKEEEKPVKVVEETQDSSDSEDSDDSSAASAASDSDSSDKSDDSSDESAEESAEESGEESDAEVSNKRSASDDDEEEEELDADQDKKRAKVEISREPKPHFGSGGTTLFVGQLDFNCTEDELRAFFEENGKPAVSIRLSRDHAGTRNNRGFGYAEFASEEDMKSAQTLNGQEFQNRNIRLDVAEAAKPRAKDENYSAKSSTVFVANLSRDLNEDALREAFTSYGTIKEVRLPFNQETQQIRGIGYIEFETEDEAEKAVKEMNGVSINGRPVRTDFSGGIDNDRSKFKSFTPNRGGRGGRGGGRGDFRGGRGGGRGDFRGGRGGGRGDFRGGRGNSRGGRGGGGFRGGRN